MGELLEFRLPEPDWDDPDDMRRTLEQVQALLARLDEAEPEDMDSEAYDAWADRHERLEDLADDLLDALEP